MLKNKEAIEQLKFYLTLQLEAYHQDNWQEYEVLEEKILEIERYL